MRFLLHRNWQALPELHQRVLEDISLQTLQQDKAEVSKHAGCMEEEG